MKSQKIKKSNRLGIARPCLHREELWILKDALGEKIREFQRNKVRSDHYFLMLRLNRKLKRNYNNIVD